MSAAATVNPIRNVARWSALAFGAVYGYTHHNTLLALEANRAEQIKKDHREHLIAEAKAAYAKKNSTGGVITDPDHPNFDFEKMLIHLSETA